MEETTTTAPVEAVGGVEPQPTEVETPVAAEVAETQPETDPIESTPVDENVEWLKSKGVDPTSPDSISKVAKMYRDAEKHMHEATQSKNQLNDQAVATINPDDYESPLWAEVQQLKTQQTVRDFYDAHPEAKEMDAELASVVQAKPYLAQDLEAAYAVVRASKTDAQIKEAEARGRERAKAELAKTSTAVTPTGNASGAAQPDKPFAELSLAEMEAKLGFVRR